LKRKKKGEALESIYGGLREKKVRWGGGGEKVLANIRKNFET